LELFKNAALWAVEKLSSEEIQNHVLTHDDLVIYFDILMSDYVLVNNQINCEDFKSLMTRYDVLKNSSVADVVEKIIDTIAILAPNFE